MATKYEIRLEEKHVLIIKDSLDLLFDILSVELYLIQSFMTRLSPFGDNRTSRAASNLWDVIRHIYTDAKSDEKNKLCDKSLPEISKLIDSFNEKSERRDSTEEDGIVVLCLDSEVENICKALEMVARLHLGQINIVEETLRMHTILSDRVDYEIPDRIFCALRMMYFGFERGASYGIHSDKVSDDARVAWDMMTVFRHRISWDKAGNPSTRDWNTMMGVNYDEPHRSSTTTSQITIRKI